MFSLRKCHKQAYFKCCCVTGIFLFSANPSTKVLLLLLLKEFWSWIGAVLVNNLNQTSRVKYRLNFVQVLLRIEYNS